MKIGQIIAERRKALELTQAELAHKSGFSQNTISMLESGDTKSPSYDVVIKLAQVLGLSTDKLHEQHIADAITSQKKIKEKPDHCDYLNDLKMRWKLHKDKRDSIELALRVAWPNHADEIIAELKAK